MTLGLSPEIQEDFGAVRSSTTPAGDAPDGAPALGGASRAIFDTLVEAWLAPAADDEDDAADPVGATGDGTVAALPLAQPLPFTLPATLVPPTGAPDLQSSDGAIAADAGSVSAPVQAADSRGTAQHPPVDAATQPSPDSSTIAPDVADFEGQTQTEPASTSQRERAQALLSAKQGPSLPQDISVDAGRPANATGSRAIETEVSAAQGRTERQASREGSAVERTVSALSDKTAIESRSIAQRLSENTAAAADGRGEQPSAEGKPFVDSARTAATSEYAPLPLPESNNPESNRQEPSDPASKPSVGANSARPLRAQEARVHEAQEKGTPAAPAGEAVNAPREIAARISDVARSGELPPDAGQKPGPRTQTSALAVEADATGSANMNARRAEPAPVAPRVPITEIFTTPAPQAATEISTAVVTEPATIETDAPLDPPAPVRDVSIGTTTAERGGSEHRAGQDRESKRDAQAGERAESSPRVTPGAEPPPFAESDAPAINPHTARQAVTVLHGGAPALVPVQHVDAPAATLTEATALSTPAPDTAERIVQSMKLQMGRGGGDAVVHLRPEHLGPVSITLRVENGAVSAVISAEHPGVAEWLQSNQQSLREGLEASGLQLERFVVQRDGQSPSDRQRREWFEARRRDFRRRLPASESTFEISM